MCKIRHHEYRSCPHPWNEVVEDCGAAGTGEFGELTPCQTVQVTGVVLLQLKTCPKCSASLVAWLYGGRKKMADFGRHWTMVPILPARPAPPAPPPSPPPPPPSFSPEEEGMLRQQAQDSVAQ
ncbi:hypothetical protein LTR17_019471 [Elasticomyces elasticus]|nr:hypothetical protein LTR17_019471 [Elasticomyces elasticus]